jgi:hypothetical protein
MSMQDNAKQDRFERALVPALPPSTEGPAFSEDGVDLTLIRWYLSLTPTERLQHLESHARAIWRIRRDNPHV